MNQPPPRSTLVRLARLLGAMVALTPVAACSAPPDNTAAGAALQLDRTISLRGVRGRIDHLAIDPRHHRLFVAELGNGTVEAIDLEHGVSLGRISGLKEPQGLAYLPGRDELVVASGGDGTVRFYRAADLVLLATVPLGDDADDVVVDDRSGRVIVGFGSGALAAIDPTTRAVVAKLDLPAHPEGFRVFGDRAFVNVPSAGAIVVGDLGSGRIVANWRARHAFNFPMALDVPSGTIAVVYRLPPRVQLIDAATGATKADAGTCGDADDVAFDDARHRLYVFCGSGAVDVLGMSDLARQGQVATRAGARTGLYSAELDRLIVAARSVDGDTDAALLVYRPR